MTMQQLFSAAERRRMCQDASSSGLNGAGDAYLQAGRWGEALECFEAAKDLNGAAQLASLALEAGDLFYYLQTKRILGQDAAESDLAILAENASKTGKDAFAASAKQRASSEEDSQ